MTILSYLFLAVSGLRDPSLIDPILVHPAISALSIDIRPRSRLKKKHKPFFTQQEKTHNNNTLLFDELALVICETETVCRKELFETYAAAIYIHAKFPDMKRMADLAAGHGLLSWFLLVLDQYSENPEDIFRKGTDGIYSSSSNGNSSTNNPNPNWRPRTVVCVDRRMPPSADKIASAMIDRFPELESRWSYIQSDLNALVPHPSCLLTSVHACGTLTDYLIELAIGEGGDHATSINSSSINSSSINSSSSSSSNSNSSRPESAHVASLSSSSSSVPLAIVPCCHTVKARNGYRPHFLSGMNQKEVASLVEQQKRENKDYYLKRHQVVADVVDEVRCETLNNAGYDVEEVMLPESFTLRNRLLLGEPRKSTQSLSTSSKLNSNNTGRPSTLFERTPPPSQQQLLLRIPLRDDEKSIAHCNSISGRARANARLIEQIPKHFSPSLVLSIWHHQRSYDSTTTTTTNITGRTGEDEHETTPFLLSMTETLQAIANDCCCEMMIKEADVDTYNNVECVVKSYGEVNVQPATGRLSQRYRFTYSRTRTSPLKDSTGTTTTTNVTTNDISKAAVSKDIAKKIHNLIRERIIDQVGEDRLR